MTKINDRRRVRLDASIPWLGGRPDREEPISDGDMADLSIDMHYCETIQDVEAAMNRKARSDAGFSGLIIPL